MTLAARGRLFNSNWFNEEENISILSTRILGQAILRLIQLTAVRDMG